MFYITRWQHECDKSDIDDELREAQKSEEGLDWIVGRAEGDSISWAIEAHRGDARRLGGGYLLYCPYCRATLPQTEGACLAIFRDDAEKGT